MFIGKGPLVSRSRAPIATNGGFPPPENLGIIYSKTIGDNLADWSIRDSGSGVTWIQNGTDVDVSGTGGTGGTGASDLFEDYMRLDETGNDFNFTCLDRWKVRMNVVLGTSDAGEFGVGMGVASENTFESRDTVCRFAFDGTNKGDHFYYYGDTEATGINNQEISVETDTENDTEYWYELERNLLTLTMRVYESDGTTLISESSQVEDLIDVTRILHNTGRFVIMQYAGDTTIKSIEISSIAQKNAKFNFMGNSISYGGKASSLANRWIKEYATLTGGGDLVSLSGWADRAEELEMRKEEVKALNPMFISIAIGSNDIKDVSWISTGNGKVDDMITFFLANTSATIILVSATARNDVDVTQVETDMLLKAQSRVVVAEGFSATKQPANTDLLGAYNSGDGIHLTDAGHDALAAEVFSVEPT